MSKFRLGFTLIELLVVIVVLGVLVAISTAGYRHFDNNARLTAGLNFEKELVLKYGKNTVFYANFDECAREYKDLVSGQKGSMHSVVPLSDQWAQDDGTNIRAVAPKSAPSGDGCATRTVVGTFDVPTLARDFYVVSFWTRDNSCFYDQYNLVVSTGEDHFIGGGSRVQCRPYVRMGSIELIGKEDLSVGRWIHQAVIWEKGKLQLFIDGKLSAEADNVPLVGPDRRTTVYIGDTRKVSVDGQVSVHPNSWQPQFNDEIRIMQK